MLEKEQCLLLCRQGRRQCCLLVLPRRLWAANNVCSCLTFLCVACSENAANSAGFVGSAAARSEAEMLRQENAVLRSTVQALAEFLPNDIAAEVAQVSTRTRA